MNLSVTSYQNTSNFPFSVSHICHRLVDLVKEPEGTGFTDYNHIQLLVKSKYWSADKRAQWKWDRTILSFLFLIHQTRLRICSSPKCLVKYNIQESPQRTWSHTTLHCLCCKGLPWLRATSWWVASLFSTGAHVSRCSQVCSTLRQLPANCLPLPTSACLSALQASPYTPAIQDTNRTSLRNFKFWVEHLHNLVVQPKVFQQVVDFLNLANQPIRVLSWILGCSLTHIRPVWFICVL